jgi:hypothetical protein
MSGYNDNYTPPESEDTGDSSPPSAGSAEGSSMEGAGLEVTLGSVELYDP